MNGDPYALERAVMSAEDGQNGFQEAVLMLRTVAEMLLKCSAGRGQDYHDYGYVECPWCQRRLNLRDDAQFGYGVEGALGHLVVHTPSTRFGAHRETHAPDCELFKLLKNLASYGFIQMV